MKKQQQQQKDSLLYHWSYIVPETNLFCDKIDKIFKDFYDHVHLGWGAPTMTKNYRKLKRLKPIIF